MSNFELDRRMHLDNLDIPLQLLDEGIQSFRPTTMTVIFPTRGEDNGAPALYTIAAGTGSERIADGMLGDSTMVLSDEEREEWTATSPRNFAATVRPAVVQDKGWKGKLRASKAKVFSWFGRGFSCFGTEG